MLVMENTFELHCSLVLFSWVEPDPQWLPIMDLATCPPPPDWLNVNQSTRSMYSKNTTMKFIAANNKVYQIIEIYTSELFIKLL